MTAHRRGGGIHHRVRRGQPDRPDRHVHPRPDRPGALDPGQRGRPSASCQQHAGLAGPSQVTEAHGRGRVVLSLLNLNFAYCQLGRNPLGDLRAWAFSRQKRSWLRRERPFDYAQGRPWSTTSPVKLISRRRLTCITPYWSHWIHRSARRRYCLMWRNWPIVTTPKCSSYT